MTMPRCSKIVYNFSKEQFRVQKIDFKESVPLHKHPCYELFFITSGKGIFHLDGEDFIVDEHSLFLVKPNRIHGWKQIEKLEGYLLKFDLSVFSDCTFFNHIAAFNNDILILNQEQYERMNCTFFSLENEYINPSSFREHAINNLLQVLFIYVQRVLNDEKIFENSSHAIFAKLNKAMVSNGFKIAQPSDYSKKLNLSKKALNSAVQSVANCTLGEYIRTQTTSRAKCLLRFETMTCNEVSDTLGFIDPAYFSRFFKRETGISPKKFRESLA